MKIYIAADHGGLNLKNKILNRLREENHEVVDMGAYEKNFLDDYPDFTFPTMQRILSDPDSRGIILCRNGVGVSIIANRYRNIRCSLSFNKDHIISAREDDNVNVLALPANYLSEIEAFQIVDLFLNTEFSNEERHIRRLNKIEDLDNYLS